MYEIYQNRKNSNNILFVTRLKFQQEDLHNEIQDSKSNFCPRITHKLNHIEKTSKAYCALLKRFLNNKKIHLIPPFFTEMSM